MTPAYHPPPRLTAPDRALWVGLRFAPAPVELFDLVMPVIRSIGASLADLTRLLDGWVAGGWVAVSARPRRYTLKPEFMKMAEPPPPPAKPRRRRKQRLTQRQRIWSAMRVLRSFDLPTLIIAAQTRPTTAADLCRIFERAGWLRRQGDRWSLNCAKRWGPQVPTIVRLRLGEANVIRVSDPADGAVIDLPVEPKSRCDRALFLTGGFNHVG